MITILALLFLPLVATAFTASKRSAHTNQRVTLVAGIAHLLASLHCLVTRQNPFPGGWWLAVDPLAAFFLTILAHTFVLVVLYSPGFLRRMEGPEYDRSKRLFYPALNFYLLANTLALVVQQFALLWVILELTTFSLAPLIFFYRSKEALEAVWKYLFLVSLGLVFLFVGVLFFGLSARGVADSAALVVPRMAEAAPQLNPIWLKAGSLRSTAVLALLRFYQVVSPTEVRPFAQKLLVFAGLFSLAVAAVYIWRNRNYKRLLAYSSVEHLGIIALGVGIGGVALLGALLHLLFNSFGKAALFFMAGNIHRSYGSREIASITNLARRFPWSGFVWVLAFFYIVGTPPFGIFFSELFVLQGMIRTADWLPFTLFLALLMVIFIGMSRVVLRMLHTPSAVPPPSVANTERLNLSHALGLYAIAASVPLAVFQPAALFDSLRAILATFGVKL